MGGGIWRDGIDDADWKWGKSEKEGPNRPPVTRPMKIWEFPGNTHLLSLTQFWQIHQLMFYHPLTGLASPQVKMGWGGREAKLAAPSANPPHFLLRPSPWLPDGDSQIFRSSGFWTMAPLRYAAKFDPFLSLDCAPTPSTLAQSKERKGSNFAIWQPWPSLARRRWRI